MGKRKVSLVIYFATTHIGIFIENKWKGMLCIS